jgi:hypothetical protein
MMDGHRKLGGPGRETPMAAVIVSQLLAFILGGSVFLLRYDRNPIG